MILLIIILSIPALMPLLVPGFYEPHDLHHFADIFQMAQSILSGQFPPRLGPDFIYNFSYPLFNFYYVLPFYIGSFIYFLTGSVIAGYKFIFILSALMGSIGMYFFARKYVSQISSLLVAVLFLYSPYKAVQIYVRGAMGEALALSFAPFVFLFLYTLVKKPSYKNVSFLSIFFSLFVLSHNYLFLLFLPFLVIYYLIEILNCDSKKIVKVFKYTFYSAVGAILITAYWWLPAFLEHKLVFSETPFNYLDHFPFIKQLLLPSWGYGSSHWGPYDEISFQIGIINILFMALFMILLLFKFVFRKQKFKLIHMWVIGSFTFCVFMMNIRSNFIWKIMPFTNFIQFPWRFLIFTTFFSSLAGAFFIEEFFKNKFVKFIIVFISIIILITINISYFKPSKVNFNDNNHYLNRFFVLDGHVSEEYKNYSEDYLLLPIGVSSKPSTLPYQKFEIINSDNLISYKEIKHSKVYWTAHISLSNDSEIIANVLYFPGWNVYVNKIKADVSANEYGLLVFDLKKGDYTIELKWEETLMRKSADLLSFFGLVIVIYFYFKKDV